MSITIAGLWRQGLDLAERHAATTVPVAAAFMFLPQVVRSALGGPPATQTGDIGGDDLVALLIIGALAFIGQASIAAIMLGGQDGPTDVADALRRSAGLLPRMLSIVLLLFAIALPLFFIAAVIAVLMVGPAQMNDPQGVVRAAGLLFVPVIIIFAYLGARFFPLFPVLVAETPSARQTLRRSWLLTRTHQWTLVGFMMSALLAIIFLTTVVNMVAGAIFGLLLGGGSTLGQLLSLTLATLVGTAIGLISVGASVAAYRELAANNS